MKKLLALVLVLVMALALVSCGGTATPSSTPAETEAPAETSAPAAALKIGISMPTKSLQRWNQDGSNIQEKFEAAGYEVDLQYAGDNEIPLQVSQIENMISGGCNVLVIAAVDGGSLTTALEGAKAANIPVIAYDRLIMDTEAVTYYASFDNTKVGVTQGAYIEEALDLKNAAGPFNIELFTGDPADSNVKFFWDGALSVLQQYIDSGKLVVKSDQKAMEQCTTEGWSTENAQKRMENLISSQSYSPTGTKLDAIMSSNDSIAIGVTTALTNAGFTADNFPVLTGQDCDITSTKNMIAGTQSMSVFKDTRTLAEQVVKMVDAIGSGSEPEINDTKTYDNGTGIIPSFLCDPVACTKDKIQEILIDSGYYTAEEVGL